jgi:hypothetical protein
MIGEIPISDACHYGCTKHQERWQDSHFLIYYPCRHLLLSIALPTKYVCSIIKYVWYQCEGDRLYLFLHFRSLSLIYHPSTHLLSIVLPYVPVCMFHICTNAKVTEFSPFCTIGISMFQKRILPYFIIPSTFSPQASSPLERYGQTEGRNSSPPVTYVLFPPTERAGPYPQAQLYWAGRTMGWMADWPSCQLSNSYRGLQRNL